MCGIAGIYKFDSSAPAEESLLRAMGKSLHHRGPDAEGIYTDRNVGLIHRRLSIIDLSTGGQPMYGAGGKHVIVFNGEIYNYIELRDELKGLGHYFETNSDTEVILKAYEQWGISCQEKFNGMWAFAIWDHIKDHLFLSRDRIGEKPLHYGIVNNTFVFGSEIKAILAYGFPQAMNEEILEIYLTLGYIPAPYTAYKGIHKLEAGHYLLLKGSAVQEGTYWDLPAIDESNMLSDKESIYSSFASLLKDSVNIRMRSDVPFGAFLSGGLDSSSVVQLMSEQSRFPVETFTIGFTHKAYDERHLARDVAQQCKTNHHEFMLESGTFEEALRNVLYHCDEPFGDSSAMAAYYVSKAASDRVKMVLTGDGGDEVLSGYTAYQGEKFAGMYSMLPGFSRQALPSLTQFLSRSLSGGLRYKLNRISSVLHSSALPFEKRLVEKTSWTRPALIKQIINGRKTIGIEEYFDNLFSGCGYKDPFYKLMYFNFKVSLPDDMLVKVDRMSMANSLETRVPFLDYRLIELMVQVSKSVKMQGYERKSVLRRSVGKGLPASILHAPKHGFNIPLREWFKDNTFEKSLRGLTHVDIGLNNSAITQTITENLEGKADNGNFIWMLFVLNNWIKQL